MPWDATAIHARLAAVRAADPDLELFGASRHRHRLGPALAGETVAAFEARHGVTLPMNYRSFLLQVGDGGAGPHYGLFPLNGDGMSDLERRERSLPEYLSTPFPHTEEWNPPYLVPGCSLACCATSSPAPDHAGPGAMTEDEYFDERWTCGSLVIGEFGCGAFHRLVITGPARGQVWFDDRASDGGLRPETDFCSWYQNWLDELR